jgi:hypothetical protein
MKTVIQIAAAAPTMIDVKRYRKPDGYATRFWAIYVDGELLAVTVYRKGAVAIADLLMRMRGRNVAGDAA